jgi:hypothetical protein
MRGTAGQRVRAIQPVRTGHAPIHGLDERLV